MDWGGPQTEVDRGLGEGGVGGVEWGGPRTGGVGVDWGGPLTGVDRGLWCIVGWGGPWTGVDRGLGFTSSSGTGRAERKWMFS